MSIPWGVWIQLRLFCGRRVSRKIGGMRSTPRYFSIGPGAGLKPRYGKKYSPWSLFQNFNASNGSKALQDGGKDLLSL
jgi:hypothetical protein